MAPIRRRPLGAFALVTALFIPLVGCGADAADTTVVSRAPKSGSGPVAASSTTVPVTTEQLESALLLGSDLPTGFDVETRGDDPGGTATNLRAVDPTCQPALDDLAPDGGDSMDLPRAGVAYERRQVARVSHQVAESPDAVERFRNAREVLTDRCSGYVEFTSGDASGHYLLRSGPRMGDDVIYLRSHLETRMGGGPADVDGFVVMVRLGDVVSTVSVTTTQAPALGLTAARAPTFAEAVVVARRATKGLRLALD